MLCINRYVDQEITLDFGGCTPKDFRELKRNGVKIVLVKGWRNGAKIGLEAPLSVVISRSDRGIRRTPKDEQPEPSRERDAG